MAILGSFASYVSLFSGQTQERNYTPVGALNAGDVVVLNGILHFAQRDIPAAVEGALAISGGNWKGVKASGALADGSFVYWDQSNNVFTATSSGNILAGTAIGAYASGDSYVLFTKMNKI